MTNRRSIRVAGDARSPPVRLLGASGSFDLGDRRNLLRSVGVGVDEQSTTGLRTSRPDSGLDGDVPSAGAAAPGDQLAPFRPLITAIRWGTLAVGFAVAV